MKKTRKQLGWPRGGWPDVWWHEGVIYFRHKVIRNLLGDILYVVYSNPVTGKTIEVWDE